VGTGSEVTIRELAALISQTVDFKGSIEFDATKPDGTPRKVMDSAKIEALGWKARTSLESGLKTAYQSFLAQVAKP
jgi:GDP-L-fucose synthase